MPARAELVRKALAVFDTPPEVWELDGTTVGSTHPQQFDRILLDAPCTGLGALRRRPEARWRKQPRDVAELAELQIRLLESALAALKPGGILAYVTCSPHPAETRAVVQSALRDSGGGSAGDVRAMDTPAVLAQVTREKLELPRCLARAALAAPARHRRDVHPAAAPRQSSLAVVVVQRKVHKASQHQAAR